MEVKKEVKHFVQDISIKRSNVHFNFHFNSRVFNVLIFKSYNILIF